MIPCYQICKDRGCLHWNPELLDCPLLPDDCDYAVEHLVSDRENQELDGSVHGYWKKRNDDNGQLSYEVTFVNGKRDGLWRGYYFGGKLSYEGYYVNGKKHGLFKYWFPDGRLMSEEYYENGELKQ